MKMIRVLVADDHAIVRAGLRALLEAAGDMLVVGEAENGQQAVREAERLRPDVVLLDLAMPRLNGVSAARQLAQRTPATRVLVLSSYHDTQHLREAIEAGVAGYLLKAAAGDDLLEAVRETDRGGAFFSPAMLQGLSKECWGGPRESRRPATRATALTGLQAEVLQLIAEGYCSKEIAALMLLSTKTVEKHRQSIMLKLDLHKIAALTRYAVFSGIIEVHRRPVSPLRPKPARTWVAEKKPAWMWTDHFRCGQAD
jgi:DNA-binding NarL/FixJ family response regulator